MLDLDDYCDGGDINDTTSSPHTGEAREEKYLDMDDWCDDGEESDSLAVLTKKSESQIYPAAAAAAAAADKVSNNGDKRQRAGKRRATPARLTARHPPPPPPISIEEAAVIRVEEDASELAVALGSNEAASAAGNVQMAAELMGAHNAQVVREVHAAVLDENGGDAAAAFRAALPRQATMSPNVFEQQFLLRAIESASRDVRRAAATSAATESSHPSAEHARMLATLYGEQEARSGGFAP